MFHRLKEKWKVNWLQFTLIFSTFALGGSLCGYLGRKLLNPVIIDNRALYIIIYIVLITLLWPVCVLLISLPFGQFPFFRNYLKRMWGRMVKRESLSDSQEWGVGSEESLSRSPVFHTIAIFASGTGSNAAQIIRHFSGHASVRVGLVVCNKPGAGVLAVAAAHGIPVLLIEKEQFFRGNAYVDELKQYSIDFIVLAGFLWKVPVALIQAYPNRIINIHPALLPKYGGKGMYGMHVHEAVIAAGDKESGITIHYVNERFDEGKHIFQAHCTIDPSDTPESLAQKIHALEHTHFSRVIEKVVQGIAV